jgi:hypothetical protein
MWSFFKLVYGSVEFAKIDMQYLTYIYFELKFVRHFLFILFGVVTMLTLLVKEFQQFLNCKLLVNFHQIVNPDVNLETFIDHFDQCNFVFMHFKGMHFKGMHFRGRIVKVHFFLLYVLFL